MSLERIQQKEVKSFNRILDKIVTLKRLPTEIFNQFQKVFGGTSLEVVPIRYDTDGKIEVFMLKRPADDPYWPDRFHVPGTMVFAWDWFEGNGLKKPWQRIEDKEKIPTSKGVLMEVETKLLDTKRGLETALVNNLVFSGPVSVDGGEWFKIDELPKNLVDHHRVILFDALHTFVGDIKSGRYSNKFSDNLINNMVCQITQLKRN